MDLASKLLLFLEVIELGSFANVAEHRNIDRSVVSKQISKLEDELNVRLLNRTTRSHALTSAGKDVERQARALRDLLNETHRVSQNYHSAPRGTLRITCTTFLGRKYIHPLMIDFQKKYPNVDVELRLEDRMVDIVGEGYDIGFRIGIPKDSSLISRKIASTDILFVASPDFIKAHGEPTSIENLESLPAIIYSSPGYIADKIKYIAEGQERFIHLNPIHRVNEDDMMIKAAISGLGIAAVTTYMIGDELKKGILKQVMPELKLAELGPLCAVYPHRDAPIKTKLFIDSLKNSLRNVNLIWEQNIQ